MSLARFNHLVKRFREVVRAFPDRRTGSNTKYSLEDFALSAFSVFFTQSPSFLTYQRTMKKAQGQSNAQSLFEIEQIPTDNQIRTTLDPVPPQELFPVFDSVYQALAEQGVIESFKAVGDTTLIALDGTWYFSSEKIHCQNCSHIEHKSGQITYYHSAITPVIVAPGQPQAIALRPEFITPQDGHQKQDCEINASKRWLEKHSTLLHGFHFIFVCKPDSHKTLYQWVELLQEGGHLQTLKQRLKNKSNQWETYTFRFANDVPLADGEDALKVNWCELTVTHSKKKVLYRNSFITDFRITRENVAAIVASGRARWKIENENNNTLKTKGYHLEHNFGHGKKHLSSLLAAMNILAFLFHTFLSFADEAYQQIRSELPTRQSFFDDIRALLRYMRFESWESLLDFMMRGLEIGPYAK
jgi:hypothetical protein